MISMIRGSTDGRQKSGVRRPKSGEPKLKLEIWKMKHTQEFKFEKIVVWQKAMDLGERLNELVERFPEKEKFNLSSQMLRAVDSVALNISEGSIGQSNLEFKRFMGYAIRSLAETVTCLHKANRRKYINENEFNAVYSDSFNLMNIMAAFRRNIK